MSEDKIYKDGDIVWVKLGNNWWPGEVTGPSRHPEGLIKHLKRVPYCVVKFFNENAYEYVRSSKQIFPFQCSKQEEFIKKGYSLFNSGNSFMEKFPTDVEVAKQLIRRKEPSLIINDRPDSIVKAILGQPLIRTYEENCDGSEYREKRRSGDSVTKILNITQNRSNDVLSCDKTKTQTSTITLLQLPNDETKNVTNSVGKNINNYQCNFCDFSSVRLNVMILHRKMHSNRDASGSSNSALLQRTSVKSMPARVATITANINTDRNQIQQNQNSNKDKSISKTKASTPTAAVKLPSETSAPLKESTSAVAPVKTKNITIDVTETAVTPLTAKEKSSRPTKLQTSPTNNSKTAKKVAAKEKKDTNAYDTILSDFCPEDTETSLPAEGNQSRRSQRHFKNTAVNACGKVSTICIDLSETKIIQKIPKKREYCLQLQNEVPPQLTAPGVAAEPDVVCLLDKEKENTTNSSSAVHSATYKKDAEDIRRMLLADWSDDDENPTDAIVVDDNTVVENTLEINNGCRPSAVEKVLTSSMEVVTSTTLVKPSTARIRNIPKKDRRDVVLEDFNSSMPLIHTRHNSDHAAKTLALDLDSSNSSVVEVIEDQQPAAIITINDDEDQENSISQKNPSGISITAAVSLINDKSTSAATSTTTLSCFDFPDDEDEQDNTTVTIPHFKKKYLSGDKLQNLSSTTTDDLSEETVNKSQAELAEKDQRLAAEIENLLEQTQPIVADLLNANSLEESMSVKDLPIKERGKRIFKSRNKTRIEDAKTNAELVIVTAVSSVLTIASQTVEEYKSNVNANAVTESLDKDKSLNKMGPVVTTDQEIGILPINQETLINTECLIEISNKEIAFNLHNEMPNENKENENSSESNKDCTEESLRENNATENQREHTEKAEVLTSESTVENLSKCQDAIVCEQKEAVEKHPEQESIVTVERTEDTTTQESSKGGLAAENIKVDNGKHQHVETNSEVVLDIDIESNKTHNTLSLEASAIGDVDREELPVNKVKVLDIEIIDHSHENLKNDLAKDDEKETDIPDSSEDMSTSIDKELETLATETSYDNGKNDVLSPSVDKELKNLSPDTSGNDKNYNHKQSSETIFKIRVKSPEQLLDQAFIMAPQEDQEVQSAVDTNVDARLINTTPTDENSSMGASDTGAEFGSPTSMLSEERLPAFIFQRNPTPHQEIETAEIASQLEIAREPDREEISEINVKNLTSEQLKENVLRNKLEISSNFNQKSLQQRRFSMDLNSLQTELKTSFKRQRLSVDAISNNPEKSIENPQEMILTTAQNKCAIKLRPKSRHMKVTPRRNVIQLFKKESFFESDATYDVRRCSSLECIKKTSYIDSNVGIIEKEQSKNNCSIVPTNEICSTLSNDVLEKVPDTSKKVEANIKTTLDNTRIREDTEDNELGSVSNVVELTINYEEKQENFQKDKLITIANDVEDETRNVQCPTEVTTTGISTLVVTSKNLEENLQNDSNPQCDADILTVETSEYVAIEEKSINENIVTSLNIVESRPEISLITMNRTEEIAKNECQSINMVSLDKCNTNKDHILETPFSPGVPPPTPQEREVVIESENLNQQTDAQQEIQTNIEKESNMPDFSVSVEEKANSDAKPKQPSTPKAEKRLLSETNNQPVKSKQDEPFNEEILCALTSLEMKPINDSNASPVTPTLINQKANSECKTLAEPSIAQQPLDFVIEFDSTEATPGTPKENIINDEYENGVQIPSTPQAKELLIIECEPSTPQGIIECDPSIPARVTPDKKAIIESDVVIATSNQIKDITVEENLHLEEKETLLEREFQAMQTKENSAPVESESEANAMETDDDKAAEEFLIEFDSIVNHSHAGEEDVQSNTVEDVINAEDLINNIIEEVHEDQQPKQDEATKTESPVPYEPLTTYTVVGHKNSWNQIFKDSFNRQLPLAKRRQTICFEISDKREGVACKKQSIDFESILPVNKTTKRTAERKLTMPAIETKLSNSPQPHGIFALNNNQITLNKKKIPTAKRKLSIEDNITSFIIERPKQPQQQTNSTSGPPPLQRIRPLSRQAHMISKNNIDNLSEPPPLQSNDNMFHELFPSESASPAQCMNTAQKPEGGHQQIVSSHAISSTSQNKITDTKISVNKQIGVDSRGNKYVIIKTPPTDIVVQPTLTSSAAAAVSTINSFGTTITITPLPRSTTELAATNKTKSLNISSSPTTSSRKQQVQQHQHQMKQISITVPAKPTLEVSNSSAMSPKTNYRNRRKATQAKEVAAATAAKSNIDSAKHRQAMEALSRRLSIASEAPPLAKISRKTSTHVQTQISNNSNLTFLGDTQISNIAQQQLIQLQQQQQQQQNTQTTSSSLPPPIILNKNAHQHSVIPRKRKIPQQHQTQMQQHQQQIAATKSPQQQHHLQNQMQQHRHNQQQNQQMLQQFITQIATQQQQLQQHNSLEQPPPLQQLHPQPVPMTQQILQQSDGIIITSAGTEDDNVIDSNTQLIALPTQPYPGYSETFLLCKVKGNTCKPVDNVPLYLNHQLNELVPVPLEAIEGGPKQLEHQIEIKASNDRPNQLLPARNNETHDNQDNLQIANINCNLVEAEISAGIESEHQLRQQQQIMEECVTDESSANASSNQINNFATNQEANTELVSNNGILLNIEGQQVLLDAATFAHLLANPDANTQLISDDGTEYVLTREVLAALQMQQEQHQALQLVNAAAVEQQHQQQQLEQSTATDIIAVALAGSDLYDNDVLTIDTSQGMQLIDGDGSIVFPSQTGSITQQHLTPPAVVTNAVLDQSPIMSTLEVPSSIATAHKLQGTQLITVPSHHLATSSNAALGVGSHSNLEDSLAAIGVTAQTSSIPSSLGLPITVTNPNIASKVTSAGPLNEMLQFVSHRPPTAAVTAAAVAAAALAGESRIFTD